MAFETITPGGTPSVAPIAQKGLLSEEDALKGADHTKSTVFSVSDMTKGSGAQSGTGVPIGSGTSVSVGQLIQGKVAIDMMDAVIPSLFVLVFYRFGIDTKKTSYQLTQGEKNTLVPMVEACLQTINLNFESPWTTLSLTLLFIYGGKAIEVGGVAAIEKKLSASRPASTTPLKGAGGVKLDKEARFTNDGKTTFEAPPAPKFEANLQPGANGSDPLGPPIWTDADVDVVVKKRKGTRADAIEWLNNNWALERGLVKPGKGVKGGTRNRRK